MMRHQLSIRSTGTMEYREIPLYASKRLTEGKFTVTPSTIDRVSRGCRSYRHTSIRNSESRFAFQRRNN